MRRFIFTVIILLIIMSCRSKDNWFKLSNIDKQKNLYDRGVKKMKNKNLYFSLSSFHGAQTFNAVPDLKYKSRQKIDSLLPIYQAQQSVLFKGLWKLKELHFKPYPESFCEFIKFEDSVIKFYSNSENADLQLIRTERILFTGYDSSDFILIPCKILFSNGEIWSFELLKKKNHLRLYPTVEKNEDGISMQLLDERTIIRDKKKRRAEYKKEYYTFYEKE